MMDGLRIYRNILFIISMKIIYYKLVYYKNIL